MVKTEIIKEGYKQTELGIIPKEWEIKRLGEIAETYSGGTPLTSRREYYNGPINWITSSDLNKQRIKKVNGKISKKGLENSSAKIVEKDTLLLALYGATAGVVAITEIKAAINQAVLAIIPFKNYNSIFLYFLFTNIKDQLVGTYTQGGQPNLSAEIVKKIKIIIPPLEEQVKISKVLTDMDNLIENMKELIDKKKKIKDGTMNLLLTGKKRLEEIYDKWEEKELGEILKIKHGKSQKNIEIKDGQFPILATGGEIGRTNNFLYNKPSVLIGRKGTIDKPQYIETPFWTVDTLFFSDINTNNGYPKFIYYYFSHMINWHSYNEASGVPSLTAGRIEKIKIFLPSLSEQEQIAKILTDLDNEIFELEKKHEKLKKIKNGMMENLLIGKIRL